VNAVESGEEAHPRRLYLSDALACDTGYTINFGMVFCATISATLGTDGAKGSGIGKQLFEQMAWQLLSLTI
jgi:hypothetical protein